MTPLQRYIAEEIAIDHIDGLLTRREALRRLGLLGLSAAAATALIAACGTEQALPPAQTAEADPPGMGQAVPTTPISWRGARGELRGAWAAPDAPRGGVLVIHENKGLNDWVRSVAGRLAGAGYAALAVDLLSEEGGTSAFADPAEATAALGTVAPERLLADVRSGVDEVQRRIHGAKLAVIGFCFGGGMTWRLLAAGEPRLSAAAPFYGPLPEDPDFSGSENAAVLAFYGSLDTRVTADEPAAAAALQRAGLTHDIVVEPDADHAYFNDTGQRYNQRAAADSWQRLLDWFGRYLS